MKTGTYIIVDYPDATLNHTMIEVKPEHIMRDITISQNPILVFDTNYKLMTRRGWDDRCWVDENDMVYLGDLVEMFFAL